jgi:hypothetical protein
MLSVLEGYVDGRNSFLLRILRSSPARNRHALLTKYLENEMLYVGLLSRVYQNHLRNQLATAVLTITLPESQNSFNEPVPVVPTQEQIEAALEAVDSTTTNCAICQDAISSGGCRIRFCGHVYHRVCLADWFCLNSRCPVCRHDIREDQEDQTQPASE